MKISEGAIHSKDKYPHATFIIVVSVLWVLSHEGKSIITAFISPNPGRKQMVHSN